jgi:chromosome segregation ATPase
VSDEEEVQSAPVSSQVTSDEIKTRLRELLNLLNQDTSTLIQDAGPIREIFLPLKSQLPKDIIASINPAAFFEGHQIPVLEAYQRKADRSHQEQLAKEIAEQKTNTENIHRQIKTLGSARPIIEAEISRLEGEREQLLKKLAEVDSNIASEKKKLEDLPQTIKSLEQDRAHQGGRTLKLMKKQKTVPGSADEDDRILEEADQIRLRAVAAVQTFLNL